MPSVKCGHGINVKWFLYREAGLNDPALNWSVVKVDSAG